MTEILREWTDPEPKTRMKDYYWACWGAAVEAAHAANPDILLPDRQTPLTGAANAWNACLDEIRRLNAPAPKTRRYMVTLMDPLGIEAFHDAMQRFRGAVSVEEVTDE